MQVLIRLLLSLLTLSVPTRTKRHPQNVETIDDDDDLVTWADAQVSDDCIELTRDYLEHCHDLDSAKHRHR